MRFIDFDFKIKRATREAVTIAGYSNPASIDRGKERIIPGGWKLANYAKNPIILFDHGKDPTFGRLPVGRATKVEPKDEGLYTEAVISSSKSDKITAVRDLVEEGILKTFSVGFDPLVEVSNPDDRSITDITSAELLEQSVVPIPMHQDATFSLKAFGAPRKTLPTGTSYLAQDWYKKFHERNRLIKKGAYLAAALYQGMNDMVDRGQAQSIDLMCKFISNNSGVSLKDVRSAITGESKSITDTLIKSFAKALTVDESLLFALREGDHSVLSNVVHRSFQQIAEEGSGISMKTKTGIADEQEGAAATEPEKKGLDMPNGVVAVFCIAKGTGLADTIEQATELASKAGYKTDNVQESDTQWEFYQVDPASVDIDGAVRLEVGDGAYVVVAPTTEPPEDETPTAPAEDVTPPQAGDDTQGEPPTNDDQAAGKGAAADETTPPANGETPPPEKKPEDQKNIDGTDDNPYTELGKAQVATLGAILMELKNLNASLKGLADLTLLMSKTQGAAQGTEPGNTETPPADQAADEEKEMRKSLDLARQYQRDLNVRLKHKFSI